MNGLARMLDWRPRDLVRPPLGVGGQPLGRRKNARAGSFRGSKSRNKVSVGEPAEGSLPMTPSRRTHLTVCCRRAENLGPTDPILTDIVTNVAKCLVI